MGDTSGRQLRPLLQSFLNAARQHINKTEGVFVFVFSVPVCEELLFVTAHSIALLRCCFMSIIAFGLKGVH